MSLFNKKEQLIMGLILMEVLNSKYIKDSGTLLHIFADFLRERREYNEGGNGRKEVLERIKGIKIKLGIKDL